jgi:hypothetical protein
MYVSFTSCTCAVIRTYLHCHIPGLEGSRRHLQRRYRGAYRMVRTLHLQHRFVALICRKERYGKALAVDHVLVFGNV